MLTSIFITVSIVWFDALSVTEQQEMVNKSATNPKYDFCYV
jgi:hypothetical protein